MTEQLHIVLIDNYDSYTYNLYQLLMHLSIPVRVTVVKNDDTESFILMELLRMSDNPHDDIYSPCDAILIGPGPGSPDEIESRINTDRNTIGMRNIQKLIILCKRLCIPLLGICLGHQAIGIAFGAKMIQAPMPMHGRTSILEFFPIKSKYSNIFDEMKSPLTSVVRYHSLLLDPSTLPSCLVATATVKGESFQTIMAIQDINYPIYGVQFHPESIATLNGNDLVLQFVQVAKDISTNNPRTIVNIPRIVNISQEYYIERHSIHVHMTRHSITLPIQKPILDIALDILDELHDESSLPFFMTRQDTSSIIIGSSNMGIAYDLSSQRITTYPTYLQDYCNDIVSDIFEYFEKELYSSVTILDSSNGFTGGWAGVFGYELHEQSLSQPKQYKNQQFKESSFDSCWIWIDKWIEITQDGSIHIFVLNLEESLNFKVNWFGKYLLKTLGKLNQKFEYVNQMQNLIINIFDSKIFDKFEFTIDQSLTSSLKKERAISLIQRCREEWIKQGDSYELCITWPFNACISIKDHEHKILTKIQKRRAELYLFRSLVKNNFAPYSCYMNWMNWWGCCICSVTPELFLSYNSENSQATMKPMKGTIKRDLYDPERDRILRQMLAESEKDKSENLMIVDLTRNDLGKLANNVYVSELFSVETFSRVHQMTSTIVANMPICNNSILISLIKAVFPPGSMTGAPKAKSVQILRDFVEGSHVKRGMYSGVIGWIGLKKMTRDGDCQLGVVIRTPIIYSRSSDSFTWDIRLHSGAAILYQSDPEAEWEEILLKAHSTWSSMIN